jgi:hypothetical protein
MKLWRHVSIQPANREMERKTKLKQKLVRKIRRCFEEIYALQEDNKGTNIQFEKSNESARTTKPTIQPHNTQATTIGNQTAHQQDG